MKTLLTAGLIAGTPVDTAFGASFLATMNIQGRMVALSPSPEAQNYLQVHRRDQLETVCLSKCLELQAEGVDFIVIFCNSLSSAVDVAKISQKLKVPLFTPFDFYRQIAQTFSKFAVLAANSTGLSGVERIISSSQPDAKFISYANLNIVQSIEEKELPDQIIKAHGLADFLHICHKSEVDVLLLGCTHYSYLFDALNRAKEELGYSFAIRDIDHGLKEIIERCARQNFQSTGSLPVPIR